MILDKMVLVYVRKIALCLLVGTTMMLGGCLQSLYPSTTGSTSTSTAPASKFPWKKVLRGIGAVGSAYAKQQEQIRQKQQEHLRQYRTQQTQKCFWICSNRQWIPIKQGVCIMPIKPITLCPI